MGEVNMLRKYIPDVRKIEVIRHPDLICRSELPDSNNSKPRIIEMIYAEENSKVFQMFVMEK